MLATLGIGNDGVFRRALDRGAKLRRDSLPVRVAGVGEDSAHALDVVRISAGEDLQKVPCSGLPAELDSQRETVARPPPEVDDDCVRRIRGDRIQVRRPCGRDDLHLFGKGTEMLDGLCRVKRPADQDDAQASSLGAVALLVLLA
jgi:hypothetical protein